MPTATLKMLREKLLVFSLSSTGKFSTFVLLVIFRPTHGTDDLLLLMKEVGSMVVSDSPLLPPTNIVRYSDLAKKEETITEKVDIPVASV